MCKLRACKRQFMLITHTLQQKRSNETADWWPFSTRGMSTFLLLKIAMKKCLFGPELNVFLVHWPLRDNVWNQVIGNCQRRNMIKNNHYYLIFLIQTLWSGYFYCMPFTDWNVGSLSNNKGDDNESALKAIGQGSVYMEVSEELGEITR